MTAAYGLMNGQVWAQLACLGLAFLLSAAIGLEREIRQKSAGLRTHTLVGFASALFMIVSKYGFYDVLGEHITLDPSRVAAQVVSGIGFLGAGLIFVRRDAVKGLTTAAAVWLTAAVGMAAGAGLWLPAVAVTVGHFVAMTLLTPLADRLPRSKYAPSHLRLIYVDRPGALREVLEECTRRGFTVAELEAEHPAHRQRALSIFLRMTVRGGGKVTELVTALSGLDSVLNVVAEDEHLS
ncbi:MgtC/SapB family protein [Sphaerisporangium rubeum]|uniref:Putative Mg2+ transporter-C (MgtC) family protein n=1 Tax=Sphaerisporangium rubeum TaxID=321317 RepID=A0A7X0M964_9ACTN|nr:MgtC/SapB family protein [Sphaerisporangium rubeum]MBB6476583.1 putative Mg2+ transporter-C (MgtC) family protein [Sphaerisporangium rubeum]